MKRERDIIQERLELDDSDPAQQLAKEVEKQTGKKIPVRRKTSLTAEEKLRAACAKRLYGTTDAEIALILGVTNHGRVNEAVKEVLAPLGLTTPGYKSEED